MASVQFPVSDMLITVKSREVQRAMAAEMAGRTSEAQRHFLAAAHLELVLADDYEQAGDFELSRRSRISAASSLWRAGRISDAQAIFDDLTQSDPDQSGDVQDVIGELKSGQ